MARKGRIDLRLATQVLLLQVVVVTLTLAMAAVGVASYRRLPIDAVPDITNVQVQINTEAPGFTPLEVEQRITFPLETALAGLPLQRERLELIRQFSHAGALVER